jgi:hypothetical protein
MYTLLDPIYRSLLHIFTIVNYPLTTFELCHYAGLLGLEAETEAEIRSVEIAPDL